MRDIDMNFGDDHGTDRNRDRRRGMTRRGFVRDVAACAAATALAGGMTGASAQGHAAQGAIDGGGAALPASRRDGARRGTADFFFEHTKLTADEVEKIVGGAPLAPLATGHEDRLAGKGVRLVFDDGEALDCAFAPGGGITVDGMGLGKVETRYALLSLGDIALFAYRVPDTLTAHIAVVDLATRQATLFEAWFAGERAPAREVQRAIRHGAVSGGEVAGHRHAPTKRLTGKAVFWRDAGDAGGGTLTVYATPMCSSYVPDGSPDTYTAASDYYEIDARRYIYSRVEAEFSGALTVEVIDLYTMEKVGVRIGIDDGDEPEFRAYRSRGEVLGQLASYGMFGTPGGAQAGAPSAPSTPKAPPMPKGMRMVYRPFEMTKPMTIGEVAALAAKTGSWTGAFEGPRKQAKMLPYSDLLASRSFRLRFDGGNAYDYEMRDRHAMRFRAAADGRQTAWKEERYEAFEADDRLLFMTHATDGEKPLEILQFAIDLKNGLATCLRSTLDNRERPREPRQEWMFGVVEMEGVAPVAARHSFTAELTGRSVTWEYNDAVASQHIFSTPESYSWSIIMNSEPGLMWSSPCKYVKIRDGVYMMSWIEHRSAGTQGTYLFNTKTMHDCGTCYGVTHEQVFEYNTFGAEARSAGSFTPPPAR
ncbi:MAG: molybdenum cofactor biosynthesis F family protein [Acidobacteriota bacterium]|jgi:hypothetical protein|nr:molybdenum cofactor biosynthesis F family protein [Acidobacteriota bacterium]